MVKTDKRIRYDGQWSVLSVRETQAADGTNGGTGYVDCDSVLIAAGLGNPADGIVYPAEILKAAAESGIFNGVPSYRDHPTVREEWDQPERAFDAKIGVVREARWNAAEARVEGTVRYFDPPTVAKLRVMKEAGALDQAALSIIAWVMGRESDSGQVVVTSMLKISSVDLVTAAGAGGVIRAVESAAGGAKLTGLVKSTMVEESKGRKNMSAELEKKVAELELQVAESKKRETELQVKEAAFKLKEDTAAVFAAAETESGLPAVVLAAIKPSVLASASKELAVQVVEGAKAVHAALKASGSGAGAGAGALGFGASKAVESGKGDGDAEGSAELKAQGEFILKTREARCRARGIDPESAEGRMYCRI